MYRQMKKNKRAHEIKEEHVQEEPLTLHLIQPQLLVGFMLLNLYFSV
jgi:hypothetical protein